MLHPSKNICVYSRFFLHAINEFEYGKFMEFLTFLKNDDLFHKSKNKEMLKTDHCRRFLDFQEVLRSIEKQGYSIKYSIESKDISRVCNDNPVLGRIVGEKC